MADRWSAVLDDLEARLAAAEEGHLESLAGFTPPARQAGMTAEDQARAARILERQRALEARLRADLARVAASMAAAARPRRPSWNATSAPVYVDRSA